VAIGLIAWFFYEYSLIEEDELEQKQKAETIISGVVRVDPSRKPEQKQNTEAKILGVVFRCLMLALLALIMGLLTYYTIKAHDEAKDMTRCFETMHNPFNSPLKTQDTPMMARVAMAFTTFFGFIGGVAFIGMVIYAVWRACKYPPP
jgi:H+/Cl- antiporter ClcA